MNKNPFYAAPEAELLVVRFEENIMSGGAGGDDKIIDDPEEY